MECDFGELPPTCLVDLDLRDRVLPESESGFLGMALHPDFATNYQMYIFYTAATTVPDMDHEVRISRFHSTNGGFNIDKTTEQILITVPQPDVHHNGGGIVFGPDGHLYIGIGDGGDGQWILNTSQDTFSMLGNLLRIDVDGGTPYAIPPDNPFADGVGGLPEIYAYGLRQPWRFSFDPLTGDLWLGDVGHQDFEEIDIIVNGGNYGWPVYEGFECHFDIGGTCPLPGHIPPVHVDAHASQGGTANAVIGGHVYRGSAIPELYGMYVYAEFNAELIALEPDGQGGYIRHTLIADAGGDVRAVERDSQGELYLLTAEGIFELVPEVGSTGDFPTQLSETGCVDPLDPVSPHASMIPYAVRSELWSDGAVKTRFLSVPDGQTVDIDLDGHLDFPVGSVLMKNFYLGGLLAETRLLAHHEDGAWGGYSYKWDEAQTDAVYVPDGDTHEWNGQQWSYPSTAQCLVCHTDVAQRSLGPLVPQLNGDLLYESTQIVANQLETLDHIGMFSGGLPDLPANLPSFAPVGDASASAEERARAYLHSNCSHCHQPDGPTQALIDLRYDTALEDMNLCDVDPMFGDVGVAGAKLLTPGDASSSVLSLRLHATDTNRMPPLATEIVDAQGTAVMDAWIDGLAECPGAALDSDGDGHVDPEDNCSTIPNPSQCDSDQDGYGNHCDADFDGDEAIGAPDFNTFRSRFGTTAAPGTEAADLNCDGAVGNPDFQILRDLYLGAPGPSGLSCAGSVPCSAGG